MNPHGSLIHHKIMITFGIFWNQDYPVQPKEKNMWLVIIYLIGLLPRISPLKDNFLLLGLIEINIFIAKVQKYLYIDRINIY